jgi:hypothetical protein
MEPNRKEISKQSITFNVPPNKEELSKMSYDELFNHSSTLGVSMEHVIDIGSRDKDKAKSYMVNECLRINPPYPPPQKPVIIECKHDLEEMKKEIVVKKVKHIIMDNNYFHSNVVTEMYTEPLTNADINNKEKEDKILSIKKEVENLNLKDYLDKESVMKFACGNGKSSGEKKLRADILMKAIQPLLKDKLKEDILEYEKDKYMENSKGRKVKKIKPKYGHIRITNYDISVY